jgi:LysM repeat protein
MPHKPLQRHGQWLALLGVLLLVMATPASAQGGQHVVQRGENLFRIALRYGVTVDAMAQANGLANPNQIYVGQTLVIPGASQSPAPAAPDAGAAPAPADIVSAPVYHIVQRGETLNIIARQYGVTWQEIATLNNLANPNRILVGQQLVVMNTSTSTAAVPPATTPAEPEPVDPGVTSAPAPATTTQNVMHIVQRGEHLAAIARMYGVSWTTIASANNIVDPNHIYAGQSLVIPGSDGTTVQQTYFEPTTGVPSGPTPTITNGKQIIVDLSDQRIYAYQDGGMLNAVTVSTGLPGTPTVVGDFNVYWKLTSQTMSGPGYYLPGVPWVMYFYAGYAIHGTYWHNNFGQPMSHGCVNLPTDQAAWFFNWAEVGTPVRVIY